MATEKTKELYLGNYTLKIKDGRSLLCNSGGPFFEARTTNGELEFTTLTGLHNYSITLDQLALMIRELGAADQVIKILQR